MYCDGGIPSNGWIYNTNTAKGTINKYTIWTISPYSSDSYGAMDVSDSGFVSDGSNLRNALGVRPVVYLNSNVEIDTTQGDGSKTNPYILK